MTSATQSVALQRPRRDTAAAEQDRGGDVSLAHSFENTSRL